MFNQINFRSSFKQSNNTSLNNSTTEVKPSACVCGGGLCSCCSRILYDTWKQKACVEVTYEPDEFSFTAKILLNGRVMYTRTISGKNPRPICIPLPRIPGVRACVRFYNIYFQGRNIHLCVNLEAKFGDTTLLKMGLDCLRFGANGVALVKPEDGTGLGEVEFLPDTYDDDNDDDDDDGDDDDDYDDDY
ncbi:uncharacterized protein [Chelonus insularis]|uniref:uncharacterized protein n=1 Tax=Chelonus insularis TaxID=460826 RepID=UPI0015893367|nr:uncharacterized protein LOC118066993 [Chelonus insularis]